MREPRARSNGCAATALWKSSSAPELQLEPERDAEEGGANEE